MQGLPLLNVKCNLIFALSLLFLVKYGDTGDSGLQIRHNGTSFLITIPNMPYLHSNAYICLSFTSTVKEVNKIEVHFNGKRISTTYIGTQHPLQTENTFIYGDNIDDYTQIRPGMTDPVHITSTYPIFLSVFVVDYGNETSMATFQALPVESWGRSYIVVTINEYPSIDIMTIIAQKAWIDLKCSTPCSHPYNGSVQLYSMRAVTISFCSDSYKGNLTGTKIKALSPIGVIAGNCWGGVGKCEHPTSSIRDMSREMFLPTISFGKEFITFIVTTKDLEHVTENLIVTLTDETRIAIVSERTFVSVDIEKAGNTHSFFLRQHDKPRIITSNHPIQVMLISRPNCSDSAIISEYGLTGVALSLLLPTNMYFNFYSWSLPTRRWTNIVVIIKKTGVNVEMLDALNKSIGSSNWNMGNPPWEVGEFKIRQAFQASSVSNFGCYVFGISPTRTFMHMAGYSLNVECNTTRSKPSDNIDNDCDGLIDEEVQDGRDSDHDFLVDEDIKEKINGQWGKWEDWYCGNETHQIRERYCNSPKPEHGGYMCQGKSTESLFVNLCGVLSTPKPNFGIWSHWSEWDCTIPCNDGTQLIQRFRQCVTVTTAYGQHCVGKKGDMRPCSLCKENSGGACTSYHWGEACQKDCYNCQDPCSKHDGICSGCKAGYKNFLNACKEACGWNEYGENCKFSCMEKCGADCGERMFGTCLASLSALYILLFLFLILPLFTMLHALTKHKQTVIVGEQSAYAKFSSTTTGSTSTVSGISNHSPPKPSSTEIDPTKPSKTEPNKSESIKAEPKQRKSSETEPNQPKQRKSSKTEPKQLKFQLNGTQPTQIQQNGTKPAQP